MSYLLGVIGSRGGIGTTNIALCFAGLMAGLHRTCLIDADLYFGNIALLLNLTPNQGLGDALLQPKEFTFSLKQKIVSYRDQFDILSSDIPLTMDVGFTQPAMAHLIKELDESYPCCIFDLGHYYQTLTPILLQSLSTIFVVTSLTMAGLRDCLRLQQYFRDLQLHIPCKIIANHPHGEYNVELTAKEFAEQGLPVDAKLSYVKETIDIGHNEFFATKKQQYFRRSLTSLLNVVTVEPHRKTFPALWRKIWRI